jgi:hypothetical protein
MLPRLCLSAVGLPASGQAPGQVQCARGVRHGHPRTRVTEERIWPGLGPLASHVMEAVGAGMEQE